MPGQGYHVRRGPYHFPPQNFSVLTHGDYFLLHFVGLDDELIFSGVLSLGILCGPSGEYIPFKEILYLLLSAWYPFLS